MTQRTRELTAARLRELYSYDRETGLFTPVHDLPGRRKIGTANKRGYLRINIDNRPQYAHRLAWLYMHGSWPKGVIDHINGNPSDNRACNLRDVTLAENSQNERMARPNNKSAGLLGVTKCKNSDRYFSRVTLSGKSIYVGCFRTAREAHEAYLAVKREVHPACTL